MCTISALCLTCGGNLTEPSGLISPPDVDNDGFYDNDVHCNWTITTDGNRMIELQFLTMDIEFDDDCLYDYITV